MKFKELEQLVIEWGEKRDLYHPEHGATALTQLHKFFEEFGELNQAILKNDLEAIKDAIGDCQVCLIHRAKFLGVELDLIDVDEESIEEYNKGIIEFQNLPSETLNEAMEEVFKTICENSFNDINECFAYLEFLSNFMFNFKHFECLNHAYNEIKDRKGKMINGTFVKE